MAIYGYPKFSKELRFIKFKGGASNFLNLDAFHLPYCLRDNHHLDLSIVHGSPILDIYKDDGFIRYIVNL